MSATNFNTKNDTFRKLMGNGLTYRIPRFQRDYSWTEEEWEDLWQDILGTIKPGGEPAHYMGYLVLQSKDDKVFDVIDGQQRLTTLSLIVLAVLRNLKRLIDAGVDPENNQRRAEQIRQTYIGYLDPVTLLSRSKLTLNHNNDNYYQTYLVPLGHLPQRRIRASEHGLRKAFEWFDRKVREHSSQEQGDEGVALASLIETASDHLFFTVITVTDELNAYKVFETLNARGVRLSATDLLKNYLFSVLHRQSPNQHEHEMRALEERWESMVGRLTSESFPDFLRIHWNSRKPFVRHTELFKTIRSQVRTREHVFELLRGMEEDLDTYLGLADPASSAWHPSLKQDADVLRMFSVRQPFSLLLAVRRILGEAEFTKILRACVMISFRYNVIGSQPSSEQERVYNHLAEQISDKKVSAGKDVVSGLASLYPSDDVFRAAFVEKAIRTSQTRNRRVVRYVLGELERQLSGQQIDIDSETCTLEHVLPKNPESGWENFSDEETETFADRLGNITLIHTGTNRDLGNVPYVEKRAFYEKAPFQITKKLAAENEDWTPARIDARQRWMAKQATSIWRVDQLS
jgi:Protein of unknown function DUF262/Protein of unknown function (DUF1524)